MGKFSICLALVVGIVTNSWAGFPSNRERLLDEVQALNLSWGAYVLGAPLTPSQRELAQDHALPIDTPGVYKFQDGSLFVVADGRSHRVVILYVQYEGVNREGVKKHLGDLVFSHGPPTLFAHDQLVYWAWGKGGKFTSDQFQAAREAQRSLDILSTVKFKSEMKIMDDSSGGARGNLYVIMTSEPALAHYKH
ncbi:MAG: hypothetical protein MI749_12000 [Desulfovibrionales bacterium]|nr:hypothetical protein [Desulfovibrionales bacterium]